MDLHYVKYSLDSAFGIESVNTVYDIGARDCAESVAMSKCWPAARIVAFEPNPNTIAACRKNAAGWPITVVHSAVGDSDAPVTLHVSTTENQGYSSLFTPSGKYDCVEPMPFVDVMVPCVRLASYIQDTQTPPPDFLWMDCQGSELSVLRGLGKHLADVKGIWTEYLLDEMYVGNPILSDLNEFLERSGFSMRYKKDVTFHGKAWFGDAYYQRQ